MLKFGIQVLLFFYLTACSKDGGTQVSSETDSAITPESPLVIGDSNGDGIQDLETLPAANIYSESSYNVEGFCTEVGGTIKVSGAISLEQECYGWGFDLYLDFSSLEDGEHSFTFELLDPSGNLIESKEMTISKDTDPPTAVTSIDDKSFYKSLSRSPTIEIPSITSSETLSLSARVLESDSTTPVTGFVNFQSGDFFENLTLTTNTQYLVEIRAIDSAGNYTSTISDGWIADVTGPGAPTLGDFGENPEVLTSSPDLEISVESTDTVGSGVASYEAKVLDEFGDMIADWTSVTLSSGKIFVDSLDLTINRKYQIVARAIDNLGNIGDASEPSVFWTATEKQFAIEIQGANFEVQSMLPQEDQTFLVAGKIHDGSDYYVSLMRLDSNADVVWQTKVGPENSSIVSRIATDTDGNIVVVGTNGSNAMSMKFESTGELVWNKAIGFGSSESFRHVATDSLGNIYAAGLSQSGSGGAPKEGYIVKLDGDGNLEWERLLSSNNNDLIIGIQLSTDGHLYVLATSLVNPSQSVGSGILLAKYSSDGTMVAQKSAYGTENNLSARDVAFTNDHHLLVLGGAAKTTVTKYDFDLNIKWQKGFNTTDQFYAKSISVSTDDSFYLASENEFDHFDYKNNFHVIGVESSGEVKWRKQIHIDNDTNLYLSGVTVDKYGRIYVYGHTPYSSKNGLIFQVLGDGKMCDPNGFETSDVTAANTTTDVIASGTTTLSNLTPSSSATITNGVLTDSSSNLTIGSLCAP
jgi:hypothetical protein